MNKLIDETIMSGVKVLIFDVSGMPYVKIELNRLKVKDSSYVMYVSRSVDISYECGRLVKFLLAFEKAGRSK